MFFGTVLTSKMTASDAKMDAPGISEREVFKWVQIATGPMS